MLRFLVSLLIVIGRTSSEMSGEETKVDSLELPDGWESVCKASTGSRDPEEMRTLSRETKENLLWLSCTVIPTSTTLQFSQFRRWSEALDRKVALDITCLSNDSAVGTVNLPWPMKARNLVYLSVRGCHTEGYFSEYFSPEIAQIPDELRVLEMKDVVVKFDPLQLPGFIENSSALLPDVECGPLTLEKLVISSRTYDMNFHGDRIVDLFNATASWDFDELFDTILGNVENIGFLCNFTHLRHIDETFRSDLVARYFKILTSKSAFPEVRLYNLSHSGLVAVPEQFETWKQHFPKLSTLDLSYNDINSFDFSVDSVAEKGRQLSVDLRYNNITSFTLEDMNRLVASRGVIIQLQNNPVLTDCDLFSRFEKVIASDSRLIEVLLNSRYNYLLESPCVRFNAQIGDGSSGSRMNFSSLGLVVCLLLIAFDLYW